jgi:hypothetical protein
MAVALSVPEQEALVGELAFGEKGFAPLGPNGEVTGPATLEQVSEPSMVVQRCGEGDSDVLTTPTGAPIMNSGNAPFHANVYEFNPDTPPVASAVTPNTAVIGGPDLTISVTGENFGDTSVIVFNGGDEPTTFVSNTELNTVVKPSTAGTPGVYGVCVRNESQTSNNVEFTFTEPTTRSDRNERPQKADPGRDRGREEKGSRKGPRD